VRSDIRVTKIAINDINRKVKRTGRDIYQDVGDLKDDLSDMTSSMQKLSSDSEAWKFMKSGEFYDSLQMIIV
jgi:uncharacterized protein YoxC